MGWGQTTVQIGSGTSTANGGNAIPVTNYDYSYSQQIVTAAEITAGGGFAGNISKLKYKFTSIGTPSVYQNWEVYMINTTKTSFTTTTDWVAVGSMTKVFDGAIPTPVANDWIELNLSTNFNYTGGNLIIAVYEKTAGWIGSPTISSYTSTANAGILFRQDTTPITISSPPTATTRVALLPQVQLVIEATTPCSVPPTGGTTVLSPNSGAPSSTVNGSVTGASTGTGLTYQWQYLNGATWTNIAGQTSANLSVTAMGTIGTRQYRRAITCSGQTEYSAPATYTTDYCTSVPTSRDGSGITNMTLGASSFAVPNATYYYHTSTIDIQAGITVPSSVTFATGYTYNTNIWIDLNDNGIFESSELVFQGESTNANPTTLNTSFLLSASANLGVHRMRVGTADSGQATPDPCYSGSYGVTVDVDVNVIAPPSCMPPTGLNTSAVGSATATINWTAASPAPSNGYQYYVSTSATAPTSSTPPTGSVGAGNTTANLTGLSPTTTYYVWVRSNCGGSQSPWAGSISFTTACNPYTVPYFEGFETGYTHNVAVAGCLSQVAVGGTSPWTANNSLPTYNRSPRTGSWNAFLQYSNERWLFIPIQLTAGKTYKVELYARQDVTSGASVEVKYGTINTNAGMTNSIVPSTSVTNGDYQKIDGTFTPATTGVYYVGIKGQANSSPWYISLDDISITEVLACTTPPIGGTTVLTPNFGAPSSTVNGSVTGASTGTGLTYQWQESTDGVSWTNIGGQTGENLITTAISTIGTHYYRRAITCSGQTEYSAPAVYTTQLVYCTPTSTSGDRISGFVTTGGTTNINNPVDNGGNNGGYTDFYNTHSASIPAGLSLNFQTWYVGGDSSFAIWVDLNENGVFDASEKLYYHSTSMTSPYSGSITIPASTTPGTYRMRIRARYSSYDLDPCGSITFGEAEDYKLIVISPCAAEINTASVNPICGGDTADIVVSATAPTTELRLYTTATGGTPIDTVSGSSGTLTSPALTATTTFYVEAAMSGCESQRTAVTVEVKPAPTDLSIVKTTVPASAADECEVDYVKLDAVGGSENNVPIFTEDFSSSGNWAYSGPAGIAGYLYNSANAGGVAPEGGLGWDSGSNVYDMWLFMPYVNSDVVPIDIKGYSNLNLSFKHKLETYNPSNYFINIFVAIDDGENISFVYGTVASGNIGPETINVDLSAYDGKDEIYLYFGYVGDSYGLDDWYLDDILISGDKLVDITWSPTSGLYTDAALTTPYVPGTHATTVYAAPAGTETYTATASTAASSCTKDDQAQVDKFSTEFIAATGNWNVATNWFPAMVPDITKCVKVPNGNQLTVNVVGAEAKNITVESGGKLIIDTNQALTVQDFVKNLAVKENFLIKDGASLVQINDGNINTGEIKIVKEFKFSAGRQEYNFVSVPVIDFFLKGSGTNNPLYADMSYVLKYNEATDYFVNAYNADHVIGKGFAIKEASGSGAQTTDGIFTGVPFNGSASISLAKVGNGYNVIGNPYPSTLDLSAFYTKNNTKIESTVWFWDNRGNTIYQQQGSSYAGTNYATYNFVSGGGTGVAAPSGVIPTQYLRPGTGFMVQAKSNGALVEFENTQRVTDNAPAFVGKNANLDEVNRYWLNMETPDQLKVNMAVVYFGGGNNAYGIDDSDAFGSSDELYALIGNNQVIIQGKAPFVDTDVVPLGFRAFKSGIYKIAIPAKEGVFEDGQKIYLKDKELGVLYDFEEGAYSFKVRAGEYNNRFEIVYKKGNKASGDVLHRNEISVQKVNHEIEVTSTLDKIVEVEFYNLTGRSILKVQKINDHTWSVPAARYDKQILVVVVKTETGEVVTKKLVNK